MIPLTNSTPYPLLLLSYPFLSLLELASWLFGVRKTFPYSDPSTVRMLKSKGMIDTLSELLAGVTGFVMFAVEKHARMSDDATTFNITVVTENATTSFETTMCYTTCVDWSVNDGVPPPEESRSRGDLLKLFLVITLVRVVCLFIERTMINLAQAKFEELAKSSSQVTPFVEADGTTLAKPLRELKCEELEEWLKKEDLEEVIDTFREFGVTARTLSEAEIYEEDIKGYSNFSAALKRKLFVAIKRGNADGVEVEVGGNVEGKGAEEEPGTKIGVGQDEERKALHKGLILPTRSSLNTTRQLASTQALGATNAAASVFAGVSVLFLVISFFQALSSVIRGLHLVTWIVWTEGITVDLVTKVTANATVVN